MGIFFLFSLLYVLFLLTFVHLSVKNGQVGILPEMYYIYSSGFASTLTMYCMTMTYGSKMF